MSNEEAIEILQSGAGVWPMTGRANNAINTAIKALSQQTEDAISRQAVLDIAKSSKSNWIDNSVLFKRVNELPTVNPQPKTDVLDKIRAEIEQAADKQFQIAMGVTDLNERYAHLQMENAYRHSLNIIDKYKAESEDAEWVNADTIY